MENALIARDIPSRNKQLVAMCLSIVGLGMVVIGYGFSVSIGSVAIAASLEALVLSIIGYTMSRKGLAVTDSKFLRLGKSLGLVGIIASVVAIVLAVVMIIIMLLYFALFAVGASGEVIRQF